MSPDPSNDHPLRLYNSLSREIEPFVPQDPTRVTMYNCGPTVYSYAHIGNARAAVVADVLFRVLRHIYGADAVVYARNITDVDDKIIRAAQDLGVDISQITEKYARIYNEDLAALNCLPPTHQPKATEHIQEMVDIIITLMEQDAAYESEGHVYFDVTKDEDYGKLSGRKLEDNLAGARVEVAGAKRNAADFVLWKPAKADEPGWSQQKSSSSYFVDWRQYGNCPFAVSPGRPGWHIECSAMAKSTLAETIDIHCGGIDLKFPHHENEIAQSETCNGKPFSKFWVHNEFLNMGRDKMSKSEGNIVLVHDLLKDWDGEVIRLALLKAHYRSELSWSEDLLRESKEWLDSAYRYLRVCCGVQKLTTATAFGFEASLFNDIGTIEAFKDLIFFGGRVSAISNMIESAGETSWDDDRDVHEYFNAWKLMGFLQRDPEEWFRGNASTEDSARFNILAKARAAARAAKDWAEADRIREAGAELGIVFEDTAQGTRWRRA